MDNFNNPNTFQGYKESVDPRDAFYDNDIYMFSNFINKFNAEGLYKIKHYNFMITEDEKLKLVSGNAGNFRVYKFDERKLFIPKERIIIYVFNPPTAEIPRNIIKQVKEIFSSYVSFIYVTNSNIGFDYMTYHVDSGTPNYYRYFIKNVSDFSLTDFDNFGDEDGCCCRI